jgi:hypothetical protein
MQVLAYLAHLVWHVLLEVSKVRWETTHAPPAQMASFNHSQANLHA